MSPTTRLPPGPPAPAAAQTVEWILRPTALLRRCHARHGDPFTLRIAWSDAPLVLTGDPAEIRRIFAATGRGLRAGASAAFLEPFAGPASILVLDGEAHLRQRRLMLPAFHGERMEAYRPLVAEVAHAELDRWPAAGRVRTLQRMQHLTLEVILRAVFGVRDRAELDRLHQAVRRALGLVSAPLRVIAMSLVRRDLGPRSPWGSFDRAVGGLDRLLYEVIARRRAEDGGDSILALLLAARDEHGAPPTDRELRDQLVTLLAAGHETTAGSLSWALERLSRHPGVVARLRDGDKAYLEAVVKEVLRVRPVLSVTPRRTAEPVELGGWTLPAGVDVTPCIYLVHRRADLYAPDPLAFRPERWLDQAPEPYAWIPFGGGIRRCLGAAFATMELQEVLRAVVARVDLRPDGARGERVRRRSIILTPARGGRVQVAPEGCVYAARGGRVRIVA